MADVEIDVPWKHRIDAVPALDRYVQIRLQTDEPVGGKMMVARTVRGIDNAFKGIGCEVAYFLEKTGDFMSARNVAFWRYCTPTGEPIESDDHYFQNAQCDVCGKAGPNPCDACLPGCVA